MSNGALEPENSKKYVRESEEVKRVIEAKPEDLRGALQGLADRGNAHAQYVIGLGNSVVGNDPEAVKYYRRAAKAGSSEAQFTLGEMYEAGDLIAQESSQMVRLQLYWFTLAAENDHADAQFNLAFMYDKGKGVPQDDTEAVKWSGWLLSRATLMLNTTSA